MILEFEDLVDAGVYEFAGYDDDGERLYTMNTERCMEVAPELFFEHQNEIDLVILKCSELGYLDIDIDPNTLEVTYNLTELGNKMLGTNDIAD